MGAGWITFDAADDRTVIEALSGRRVGVIRRPDIRAGTGLQIVVPAWVAVVSCADGTSAVIGDRTERTFNISAGPATGTRTDYLWADIDPDASTWQLAIITQAQMANRRGVLLATITVPQGANTAAAMSWTVPGLTFGGAGGVLAVAKQTDTQARSNTSFASATTLAQTAPVQAYAGRIYRIRHTTPSAGLNIMGTGSANWMRLQIARDNTNPHGLEFMVSFPTTNDRSLVTAEYVGTLTAGTYTWGGRYWCGGNGEQYRTDIYGQNNGLVTTVEDCGPTHLTI